MLKIILKFNILSTLYFLCFLYLKAEELDSWSHLSLKGGTYFKKSDDKPFTGILKNFHNSGSLSLKSNFKDGKQHGEFQTFHPNGKISIEGNFEMGKKIGRWSEFYDDGSSYWKLNYTDGKIDDGLFEMFHKNGNLRSSVTYKNDMPATNWTYYDEIGEIERIDIYKNGKFIYEKHLN